LFFLNLWVFVLLLQNIVGDVSKYSSADGIVFAIIILFFREFFAFLFSVLRKKKNGNSEIEEIRSLVEYLKVKVGKLYDMHNRYDDKGIPIWYSSRGMEDIVREVLDLIKKQNDLINKLSETINILQIKIDFISRFNGRKTKEE